MQWFRGPILTVANLGPVERFSRSNLLVRNVVNRFVAGEDLESALPKVAELAEHGITATLDELGENCESVEEAQRAVETFIRSLRTLAERSLEPNISIKLTMLGLDLGDDIALECTLRILAVARDVSGFVRIDMEGSDYVDRTMAIFEQLHDAYPDEVGIVIQSYLFRARADVERMISRNARVRLVKGAYSEPSSVAFPDMSDIDDNYLRLMYLLIKQGRYPAIATHDQSLIKAAQEFARTHDIAPERFEFQMLYGVRRDLQTSLVKDGYRMRVYVPFGRQWFPYFMRRLGERPENVTFVLKALLSEK